VVALRRLVCRFPLACYFAVAYGLAGLALAVIGWPRLRGAAAFPLSALVMFPVMVVGVGAAGVALTAAADGRAGLRALRSRLTRWRLGWWYATLLIPPLGILAVLTGLRLVASPRYAPGFLAFGVGAGLFAGFCEELGWTGFAYPRLRPRFGALGGALLLRVLWGLWHLPVADSLGAASPHGRALPAFFGAFVALMAGLRVLIAWVYANTESLLGAQLLDASSTGCLVMLGAPNAAPAQEARWYLAYAALEWAVVAVVVLRFGPSLTGDRSPELGAAPA
jgi:membrane protease YdiL (CAAX protease family)